MTDPDYTHIAVVVDRSGSMFGIRADMIGGLDELFKSQAGLPGKCLVDYAQFDTEYELVFEDTDISKAKAQLDPRGGTALLDAIGITVANLGKKLADLSEDARPGKVLVVVVTDGEENSSKEYKKTDIKALVEKQESEFSWNFVFLGANMDAVSEGMNMGVTRGSTLTFDPNNIPVAMASVNAYTTAYRSKGSAAFTDEDRQKNS